MNNIASRKWVDIKEAGSYFSISPKTLYSLAARKRLPEGAVLRIGRQIRIDIAVIEAGTTIKGKK
jgi:hypothetical protein